MYNEDVEKILKERGFTEWEVRYFRQTIYDKPPLCRILQEIACKRNKRCLDVGCGIGVLEKSSPRKTSIEFVGLDLNRKYLRFAKSIVDNCDFVAADARCMPFKNETFDMIVAHDILYRVKLNEIADEVIRVLVGRGDVFFDVPNLWFFRRFPQFLPFEGYITYNLGKTMKDLKRRGLETISQYLALPSMNTRKGFSIPAEAVQILERILRNTPTFLNNFFCKFWYLTLLRCRKMGPGRFVSCPL